MLLTKSMQENILYRKEYGRNLNDYSNVYRLLKDVAEQFERFGMVAVLVGSFLGGTRFRPMET
jgi:hypothetical protein